MLIGVCFISVLVGPIYGAVRQGGGGPLLGAFLAVAVIGFVAWAIWRSQRRG